LYFVFFREQFADKSFESKLDAVAALSCLLQGPAELGNAVLGKPGVMDILLALADSKEIEHQVCRGSAVLQQMVQIVLALS